MKAIINTYLKSELAIYDGRTFDIVGHCNGHLEIEIEGIINDFELKEVLIVDIENELRHAAIRNEKTFCDYWYSILTKYVKENTIKFKLREVSGVKSDIPEIESTFDEIEDEHIL
jgi:hypothetical protein